MLTDAHDEVLIRPTSCQQNHTQWMVLGESTRSIMKGSIVLACGDKTDCYPISASQVKSSLSDNKSEDEIRFTNPGGQGPER